MFKVSLSAFVSIAVLGTATAAPSAFIDDAGAIAIDPITDVQPAKDPETEPEETSAMISASRSNAAETETVAEAEAEPDSNVSSAVDQFVNPISINYFGLLFGPSLGKMGMLQSTVDGQVDPDAPVELRNFLGLGWNITNALSLTGTLYWAAMAQSTQPLEFRDPFIKLAHNSVFNWGGFNLYADLRVHFPISWGSRNADMLASVQTFQMLTWAAGNTGITLGLWGSLRGNYFGSQGVGSAVEAYVSPNVTWQMSEKLGLQILYQINASQEVGSREGMTTDDVNIEPGLVWDITQNLMLNPFVRFHPYNGISPNNTSMGLLLNWTLL